MNSPISLDTLHPADKRSAGETLAQAFRDDPVYIFVFPQVDDRLRNTARLAEALITSSLHGGEVYTTLDLAGVSCWLSPGHTDLGLLLRLVDHAALAGSRLTARLSSYFQGR